MSPATLGLSLGSSSSSSSTTTTTSNNNNNNNNNNNSGGGQAAMSVARNASKNIKCPHCNWHYKYAETLANHIKDKHPAVAANAAVNEQQTAAAAASYPLGLASCGSSGGGLVDPSGASVQCRHCLHGLPHPRLSRGESYPCGYKPYRCDVCDYSTTTKGNLAIHKQSDKHLNNAARERGRSGSMEAAPQPPPPPPPPPPRSSAALVLATMAPTFDPRGGSPWDLANGHGGPLGPEPSLPPPQLSTVESDRGEEDAVMSDDVDADGAVLQCAVCHGFESDSLDHMAEHMESAQQITSAVEMDSVVQSGEKCWTCRVCPYQSTLKANFQLHCKTDKHLQRLRFLAHLSLGNGDAAVDGAAALAKMEALMNAGCGGVCPVLIRCRLCGLVVNSGEKMRVHLSQASHDAALRANAQLDALRAETAAERKLFNCVSCSWVSGTKLGLLRHVASHDHAHTITMLQVAPLFRLIDPPNSAEADAEKEEADDPTNCSGIVSCPLCGEQKPRTRLERHLIKVHSTSPAYLSKVIRLVNGRSRLTPRDDVTEQESAGGTETKEEQSGELKEPFRLTKDPKDESAHALFLPCDETSLEGSLLRCHFCGVTFSSVGSLFAHLSEMGHAGRPDLSGRFLCWKIGCNQYFQSQQSLQLHFGEIHVKRLTAVDSASTPSGQFVHPCRLCPLAFRGQTDLAQHLAAHSRLEAAGKHQSCVLCAASVTDLRNHLEEAHLQTTTGEAATGHPTDKVSSAQHAPLERPTFDSSTQSLTPSCPQEKEPVSSVVTAASSVLSSNSPGGRPPYMDHMSHMHQTAAYPVLFPPVPPPLGMPSPAFMGAPSPSPVGFSYWPYLMANHILPPGYGPPSAAAALWADYSGVAATPCEALGASGASVTSTGPPPGPRGGHHPQFVGNHLELSFRRYNAATPPHKAAKEPPPSLDEPLSMEELYLDRRGGRDPESYTRLLEQFALSEIVMRCEEAELPPHPSYRCTLCPDEKVARFSDLFALKLHREKVHEDFLSYETIDSLTESLLADAATPPGAAKEGKEPMETEEASKEGGEEGSEVKEEAPPNCFPPPAPPLAASQGATPGTAAAAASTALRRQPPAPPPPPPPPPPQLMLSGNLALSQCAPPAGLPVPLAHLHGPDCGRTRCNGFGDARRGRTRLSEQQRRILRASFSMSQSPSEEDIGDLAQRTQLPGRVVKHWFRNTLFKERQKCRDSPYNFGVPPKAGGDEEGGEEEKVTNGPGESSSASRSQSVSSVDSCMDSIEMESNPDGDLCWQPSGPMPGPMAAAAACDGGQLPSNYPYFYRQYLTYILSHIQQQQQHEQHRQQQHQHQQFQDSLQLQKLLHFQSAAPPQPPTSLAPPPPPPQVSSVGAAGGDATHCSISAASSAASLPSNATSEEAAAAAIISGATAAVTNGTSASPSPQPPPGPTDEAPNGATKAHTAPLFVPSLPVPPPPADTANGEAPSAGATHPAVSSQSGTPGLQQYHRRVRTTINNNQLSYLLSCYEKDSNPSKRQQEAIASRTGLPRRVVQVWFQNTRARDRKGTLRGIGANVNAQGMGGVAPPPPPPPPPPPAPHQALSHAMAVTSAGPAAKIRRQESPVMAPSGVTKQCPRCTATFRSTTAFELHTIRCRPPTAPSLQLSPPGAAVKAPTVTVAALAPPRAHERTDDRPQTPPSTAPPPPPTAPAAVVPPPLLPSRQMAPMMPAMRHGRLPLPGAFAPPPVDLSREAEAAPASASASEGGLDLSNDQPLDLSTWQKPREVSPPCLVLAPPPQQSPIIAQEPDALANVVNGRPAGGGGYLGASASASAAAAAAAAAAAGANKRSRTNITPFQLRMMREIFPLHKMPTVAECETLGKRIGLSRRVVQVWFQNQRAKEKKNAREGQAPGSTGSSSSNDSPMLDSPQSASGNPQPQPQPRAATGLTRDMCSLCNLRFDGASVGGGPGGEEGSLGAHLFSAEHLANLGAFLEKCGIQQHRDTTPGKCLLSLQRPPDSSSAYVSMGGGASSGGSVVSSATSTPLGPAGGLPGLSAASPPWLAQAGGAPPDK